MKRIILILVLVVFFVTATFVLGIYKLGWDGGAAKKFAEVAPLPAAIVAGKPVPLSDFWKLKGDSKAILEDLVQDKIVVILAREKNIEITSEELKQYSLYLLARFGLNEDLAGQEIYQQFGLTEEDFQRLVVVPDLTRNKLAIWWQEANRPNSAANRVNEAERKLLEGLTFREVARLYSDDEQSRYIGGDLGFLALEELPPWFRDAITSLKLGDMSRIVAGPEGYYLFQAAARDSVKDEIQVKQIFIRNDGFEEFLVEQATGFKILVFKGI